MTRIHHYFYCLLSDEEVIGEAWKKLSAYYRMKEDAGEKWIAASKESSLSLNLLKHVGALDLSIVTADVAEGLSKVEEGRKELNGLIDDLIGECTVVVYDKAGKDIPFPGTPIEVTFMKRELFIYEAEEGNYRRYYAMRDDAPLKNIGPIDCLLFQSQRQMHYYEGQLETFSKKRAELDRKAGEVLFKKKTSRDLDTLESDMDELSEAYGLMANYRFLLKDAASALKEDLREIETLAEGLIPGDDPFFRRRHISGFRSFLERLMESQREFNLSLEGAKSAIDVIKSRIELARSRTSLIMQEEALNMAIAASFVEFFLVLYYGLQIWKTLAGKIFSQIPLPLIAVLIAVFSIAVVAGTHRIAKALKGGRTKDVYLWGVLILSLAALIVVVSLIYSY